MAGGPKKHLKRIATPKVWCLDKLGGIYAPKPSAGPHKMRECIPMALLLRNKLKYALTYDEVKMIVMQRLIKVDGRIRCDKTYPLGFMDCVSIEKTKEHFRMMYDTKGRFTPVPVDAAEAQTKLCRVRKLKRGSKSTPYAYLHDGRTVRFAHPDIKVNDSVKIDIATGRVLEHIPFQVGNTVMVTGGKSAGRVGRVIDLKKIPGSVASATMKDARGETFSTRVDYAFIIGRQDPACTVPKGQGIKKSIIEEQIQRFGDPDATRPPKDVHQEIVNDDSDALDDEDDD